MKAPRIIIAGAAALALVAGGTAVGAAVARGQIGPWGVIHGCYKTKVAPNGSHAFVLQDAGTKCATGSTAISWNQQGPAGPPGRSGVVSMEQYQPNDAPSVIGSWALLGSPPEEDFTDRNTAAQVTGTVAQFQGIEDNGASGYLGVCYEPAGGTGVSEVSQVFVGLNSGEDSPGVTVSGVVGNVTPGEYYVGLCAEDQGPMYGGAGIVNGEASVTIIMAETASGVSYGTRRGATPTQPTRGW